MEWECIGWFSKIFDEGAINGLIKDHKYAEVAIVANPLAVLLSASAFTRRHANTFLPVLSLEHLDWPM